VQGRANALTAVRAMRESLARTLAWIAPAVGTPVQAWRRRMLAAVLLGLAVFGTLGYVPTIWLAYLQGEYTVIFVDTAVYGVMLAVLLARSLAYAIRASAVVAVPAVLGTYFLVGFGFEGAGFLWMMAFPILATVLLGLRAGVVCLCLTTLLLMVIGVLIPQGAFPWANVMTNAAVMWAVSSISLTLLATLMSLSIGVLFSGLDNEASARALAELESARLADAVNQSDGSVFLVNTAGEVIYANSRARSLANDAFRLDRLPEWSALLNGVAWAGRTEFRPAQGETMTLSGNMSPVRDDAGAITHVLATLRDVSRERDLETRLQQAQKLEAIGTLAGGIAHDFNNLLQPIVANTESVQAQLGSHHESQPLLSDIRQSAERARALVRRILMFTRAMEHERGVVELGTLLVETERLLRTTLPANVIITVSSTPDVRVVAEAGELQQVLLNLATNAAHAMPDGGTLRLVACLVDPASDDDARNAFGERERVACLSVTDDGMGMDATTLARAFDPFFTTKGPGRGTGLGLAMVHGTVTALGGIVVPRSTPDRGTSMRVYLPAAENGRTEETTIPAEPIAVQRRRVFVIDDDQAVLTSTLRLLTRLGYEPLGCTDPDEALASAGQPDFAVSCVLTDYSMPVMSGLELARKVRAIHPALPIILMTGFLEHDELSRAEESGVSHILSKPFTSAELRSALALAMPVTSRT